MSTPLLAVLYVVVKIARMLNLRLAKCGHDICAVCSPPAFRTFWSPKADPNNITFQRANRNRRLLAMILPLLGSIVSGLATSRLVLPVSIISGQDILVTHVEPTALLAISLFPTLPALAAAVCQRNHGATNPTPTRQDAGMPTLCARPA